MPRIDFLVGLSYHGQAARLLANTPSLRRFLVMPIVASLVAGIALYAALLATGWMLIGFLLSAAWIPLVWILQLILVPVLLYLTGWIVARFGVVLGSPWYGQLAEELERGRLPGGEVPNAPEGLVAMSRDIALAAGYEAKKLLLVLAIAPVLLLVGLIPVAGAPLATVGWVGLGVTTLVLDFLDPALQRRGLSFRDKLRVVLADWQLHAGFGLLALVLVGIPIVNFVAVPLCMTAGALIYCDRHHADVTARLADPQLLG